MKTIVNWRGENIEVVNSKGGVLAVVNPKDNLIMTDTIAWPPCEIGQKLYKSRHAKDFEGPDHEAVLGYYSDLQSLHSEDAITWSVFGTLAYGALAARNTFMDALLSSLEINSCSSKATHIALWRRIPHPDTLVSGGPEIDVILQTERAIIFCEAKWRSNVGRAQGKDRSKDQITLRREFFEKYGEVIYGAEPHFVVLGISLNGDIIQQGEPQRKQGRLCLRDITWDAICDIEGHPNAQEVRSYLKWKKQNSIQA